jgi:hypothetical protein
MRASPPLGKRAPPAARPQVRRVVGKPGSPVRRRVLQAQLPSQRQAHRVEVLQALLPVARLKVGSQQAVDNQPRAAEGSR